VSKTPIKPENLPERLIWYYLIGTYLFYLLGAQSVVAPILATFLIFYLLNKWLNQTEKTSTDEKIKISLSSWVWFIATLVIEFALIVGHLDFDLGTSTIIRSTSNWYRGWVLFTFFIFAGHLNIRPQVIYRATCIVCLQSLIVLLVASLAILAKIPPIVLTSPLKVFGGNLESYNIVLFYIIDEGKARVQLFAPWAPALGFVANIYFCFALQESNLKWRWFGLFGSVAMIVLSVSRLAIITPPIVLGSVWLLTNFFRPWVQLTAGFISMILGIFAPMVIDFLEMFKEQFHKARAGSSEVRAALRRMAKDAWWNEAPIWGHGAIELRGPALVGHIPIGTHHTWFGTLYTQGLVGCAALAVAFLASFIELLTRAQTEQNAKVGLSVILVILLFTTADNIDTYSYLYWPGLVILGIALKPNSVLTDTTSFD
jgi:hypothetical protein